MQVVVATGDVNCMSGETGREDERCGTHVDASLCGGGEEDEGGKGREGVHHGVLVERTEKTMMWTMLFGAGI